MKQAEVNIGGTYAVKVSGVVRPVTILEERTNPFRRGRSFVGRNETTGRNVSLTAAKCRFRLEKSEDGKWRQAR